MVVPVMPPEPSAQVQRLASMMLPRVEELSVPILAALVAAVPELAPTDIDGAEEVALRSAQQHIGAIFSTLAYGARPDSLEPPSGARTLLRQIAAADGDAMGIARGYRIAHHMVWEAWAEHVARHITDAAELSAVLALSSAHMFSYIDHTSNLLTEQYRTEFGPGHSGRPLRADLIEHLLTGTTAQANSAARTLRHPLDTYHLALIAIRIEPDADPHAALLRTVAGLDAPHMLTHDPNPDEVWAWCSGTAIQEVHLNELLTGDTPGVIVTVGDLKPGRDGLRESHRQARDTARTLRLGRHPRTGVRLHRDTEFVTLLCRDTDRARRFAADRLGALNADTDAAARLRDTLRVYLGTGGSKARTGELMHLHHKTVTYRIGRAHAALGRPNTPPSELDAALQIDQILNVR